ncbi:MAG: acetate--CoA ligase [Chromatiales bacterium]|jgi:acetyl-CoA synthetase|nr:acetate--CoA ligase [Chromatiales bacterium]
MSEGNIKSILNEERLFQPPTDFVKQAALSATELEQRYALAAQDSNAYWEKMATDLIVWDKPWSQVLDDSKAPNYKWFSGGELNVSANCLDVHLETRADKTAIIFEGEQGGVRRISYAELTSEVSRFANALKASGISCGDRVVIYMPMVPEAVIAMQACARIGAIHSVVFGGFSAVALRDRINDAGARMLITADGGFRGGSPVELKRAADEALSGGCPTIERVIVLQRTKQDVPMKVGRDIWWSDAIADQCDECAPLPVEASHPLFLLYTSGSTGKPKGVQHGSAGYLLNARLTYETVFDYQETDVFWCTADVGWITGHSYVAYGPLAAGATILMYEGSPTVPDAGRFWKICETHKVTVFYTAPTAIRALMRFGDEVPESYDLSSIRLLGSVGEPINPEAWTWYHRVIGREVCPIVDTWWQTETGGIMMSPVPSVTATPPGSCTQPLPGIAADIVDDQGNTVTSPELGGYLVIRKPWPSMLQTIWGDNDRYIETYWEKFHGRFYVAGDSAHTDKHGNFWIMGRIDDVLNVSGHRLGTMEVESALVSHEKVVEAAVVGRPDEIKGEAIFAYVVPCGARPSGDDAKALVKELRAWVSKQVGPIAKPDNIRFADSLPKTRSGKIMRRLLRTIASGEAITQDTSTLEDPSILDQLRGED